jgi:uncharacterized integral membrane protein (TIGR00697 family)
MPEQTQDKFLGKEPKYYDLFMAMFVAILIVSEITSTKLIHIGPFRTAGAIILFPLAYIVSDVLTEVYGYARARRVMWVGFMSLILMSLVLTIVQYLPAAPIWNNQEAYEKVLGFVPRISIASIIAYWAGGFANDFTLAKMKLITKGKMLWARTIGSTAVGQAVDSVLFIGIAYYAILPGSVILQIALTQYLLKLTYETVATPLTYFVVNKLKQAEGIDVYDTNTNFTPFKFKLDREARLSENV